MDLSIGQFCQRIFGRNTMQFQNLVARGVATDKFNPIARTVQTFCEQPDERFVRSRIHRWGGNLDSQFGSKGFADLVRGSSRLELDRQHHPI
jgi:hypothetical protein